MFQCGGLKNYVRMMESARVKDTTEKKISFRVSKKESSVLGCAELWKCGFFFV